MYSFLTLLVSQKRDSDGRDFLRRTASLSLWHPGPGSALTTEAPILERTDWNPRPLYVYYTHA